MQAQEKGFWVVWNPRRGVPQVKHPYLSDAKREAERLSTNQPGEDFYVLRAESKCHTPKKTVWENIEEIPF